MIYSCLQKPGDVCGWPKSVESLGRVGTDGSLWRCVTSNAGVEK